MKGWKIFCAVMAFACVATAQETYRLIWTHGMNENPQWCATFKDAGFDSLTVAIPPEARNEQWWLNSDSLQSSDPLLSEAGRVQLRAYYQVPLGMGPGTKIGGRTVTAAGFKEPLLACPLNNEFWSNYLIPAVSAIARKSLHHSVLKGVILDTEQYYGKERSGAINDHYCFCDECFGSFHASPLPAAAERKSWLEAHHRESDYWQHLENRMEEKAAKLAETIKAIAPDFEIHFYIYEPTWYYRGLLKGLVRLEHPIMICDGKTYDGFLQGWSEEARISVRELNPRAVWSPGFYTAPLNPRTMGANVRKALETGGSYWIYNNTLPFPFEILEKLPK